MTELEKMKKVLVREYLEHGIHEEMVRVMAQVFATYVDCKKCPLHNTK